MQAPVSAIVYSSQPKVPLTAFVPELAFEFPDFPEEAFPNYVLRAVNRFAIESNALRRKATIHVQECVGNYLLEPVDCMDLLAVLSICQVNAHGCNGPVTRLTTKPCRCGCMGTVSWIEEPNIIWFNPARFGDVYEVTFSVTPTYDACDVDRRLLTEFYDTIMFGTRSYIYGMSGKPWSSVQRSQEQELRFITGCKEAALRAMLHNQRGVLKAKLPKVF